MEAARAAQWVDYHSRMAAQYPQVTQYAALAWQWKSYEMQQRRWSVYYKQAVPVRESPPAGQPTGGQEEAPASKALPLVTMRGAMAFGLRELPATVHRMITAANALQDKPYIRGGGHTKLDDVGYDCSSAVSYVLIKAGLLHGVMNSSRLAEFGSPGTGRFLTIWVRPGHHVFLTICGLRLDTSGGRVAEGPRWRTVPRDCTGFVPRHVPGL